MDGCDCRKSNENCCLLLTPKSFFSYILDDDKKDYAESSKDSLAEGRNADDHQICRPVRLMNGKVVLMLTRLRFKRLQNRALIPFFLDFHTSFTSFIHPIR